MARFRLATDHTFFVQWLIAYILLHPYLQLAAAVSLPSQNGGNEGPAKPNGRKAPAACDPYDPDFGRRLLCNTKVNDTSSANVTQSPHVETPAPNSYGADHPFFVWEQSNFVESRVLEYYRKWSVNAHRRRLNATLEPMDETRLFVYEHLQWSDFICGADTQNCGCNYHPSFLNEIIGQIPDDAVLARRIYFTMKMLSYANRLICTLLAAGNEAKVNMLGKAGEFAEIFFVQPDAEAEAHCEKMNALVGALDGAAIAVTLTLGIEFVGPLGMSALGMTGLFPGMLAGAETTAVTVAESEAVVVPEVGMLATGMNVGRILPSLFPTNMKMDTILKIARGFQRVVARMKKTPPEWNKPHVMVAASFEKFMYNYANIAANDEYKTVIGDGGVCGLGLPQDQREDNTAAAMVDITSHMKMMEFLLTSRMSEINEGLSPPEDEPQDHPSEMSFHLTKLFGKFVPEDRLLDVFEATSDIADTIEQFMTERLVEKAWRSNPCYVHCGNNPGGAEGFCSPTVMGDIGQLAFCPDLTTACQAACWRGGPDMHNDVLYGYNDTRIGTPRWNINLTDVVRGSYWDWSRNKTGYLDAYAQRSQISSLDGIANARGVRLPVCSSAYTTLREYTETDGHNMHHSKNGHAFPCNCGDSWGDNTQPFYRSDSKWSTLQSSDGFGALGDYVEMCRSQLQKPFGREAAKFAVNMCYVTMRTYPENHEGLPNYSEPSRTREGREVCLNIVDTVYRMQTAGKSEAEINSWVCGVVDTNRGETFEKGKHEGFQRVLHEIQDKCD